MSWDLGSQLEDKEGWFISTKKGNHVARIWIKTEAQFSI
jgi:hypothetical protein